MVDRTGMKVRVRFGDSMSNRSRDIQLPRVRDERTAAYAGHHIWANCHLATFCLKSSPNNVKIVALAFSL